MTKEEVKAARRKLGLTQQEMSNLLNVSLGTVQTWESGARNIKKDTALLLLSYVDKQNESGTTSSVQEPIAKYDSSIESSILNQIAELKGNDNDPRWGRLELLVQQMANELKSKNDKLDVIQNITGSIHKLLK